MIDPTLGASPNTHATVATLLDAPADLPVLDVGAGGGNFTAHLQQLGHSVIALDFKPASAFYEPLGYASAPFIQANIDEELPVADGAASGAVSIEVFEHLENPLRALGLMTRAVAPGGFLIVTTPNVLGWGSRLELLVRGHHEGFDDQWYETNGHISPVSLTQLWRMADRLGLTVERVTYNLGRWPLPKVHRFELTRRRFRNQALGETLIVKFRKTGVPRGDVNRG